MTASTRRRLVVLRALAVPALLAGYVYVMGSTGACPLCSSILHACRFEQRALADDAPAKPTQPATKPADKPADPPTTKPAEKPTDPPAAKPSDAPAPTKGPMHEAIYNDLDGKLVDLADAAGKPMVLELWATWCGPCRKQRESMHALSAAHPDVMFVAASVDQQGASVVKQFLASHKSPDGSTVRELMATPELVARINRVNAATSIPKVVYVNKKGQIVDVALGVQNPKFMEAMLKNLAK